MENVREIALSAPSSPLMFHKVDRAVGNVRNMARGRS